jgi:O-antigen/teichoic acid export membrane protein
MGSPPIAVRPAPEDRADLPRTERGALVPRGLLARVVAYVKTLLAERDDRRVAQLVAGNVFLVRLSSALIALVSQVLLARLMGRFEFGVYVFAWTCALMIGALSDLGLASAARRFIPEYSERGNDDLLRGFLVGSRWLAFGIATAMGTAGMLAVTVFSPSLAPYELMPLYLACLVIPVYGLVQIQAGIAQSFDWPNLALAPFYLWRQIAIPILIGMCWLFGAPTGAVSAMMIAAGATWAVTLGQGAVLNRRLAARVAPGPRRYAVKTWFSTAVPMFVVEGFYLLLTYVDILALERFRSPDEIATYYAAARLLAVVAFVYFAIAGATTHKFTKYHVAGDSERLAKFFAETARWTFWPSLALCAAILALGRPLLSLFGADFAAGYGVMFILSVGLLARAAVGPAERLLNMLGEQRQSALAYATAFAVNLGMCLLLIPHIGIAGAAAATSTALVIESLMLYRFATRRLRYHVFIVRRAARPVP